MKRLHVHVSVENLPHSIQFYNTLFATQPIVTKPDYAKWMLDDPRVNFAISTCGDRTGVDHLGTQVETPNELHEVYGGLQQADRPVLEEGATTCCYAKSEKAWITDPQGLSWETFLTSGESTVYGDSVDLGAIRTAGAASACSAPDMKPASTVQPATEFACCAAKATAHA